MAFYPATIYSRPIENGVTEYAMESGLIFRTGSEYLSRALEYCNTYQRTTSISDLHTAEKYEGSILLSAGNYAKLTVLHTLKSSSINLTKVLKYKPDDDVTVLQPNHLDIGISIPIFSAGWFYEARPLILVDPTNTTPLSGVFPAVSFVTGTRLVKASTWFPAYNSAEIYASNTWGAGLLGVQFSAELVYTF